MQVAVKALNALRCPDVRRYEGEPLAKQIKLVGTPDLVAGPLKGGNAPEDFYIDVVQPTGAYFVEPKARVKSGDFREQLEHAYLNKVDEKIAKYATSRNSIMFGMAWAFNEIGGNVPPQRKFVSRETALVLGAVVGLDKSPDGERMFQDLESMLDSGGSGLLIRVVPLSLDLSFFLWAVEREPATGRMAFFLAINARFGSDGFAGHPVDNWLRDCSACSLRYGTLG